ncbi:MAG: sulfur-carrier protein [Actinomycetota bacterium]|nr:sulfur-carrier protein [Actinomycetota bacterium]
MREGGGAALIVVVRLAAGLRPHADGAATVEVDVPSPATVGAVLDGLTAAHPGVGRRIRDEVGALRRHVNVFVGSDKAGGVDTTVPDGTEVTVLPAVSGG